MAFAAQVGAGFTAELGAMRISDEIDALEVMSVPTLVYLVCTRVVAALICIIPLYLFSLFASFLATELVTTQFFGLSPGIYDHYFRLYLPPIDVHLQPGQGVRLRRRRRPSSTATTASTPTAGRTAWAWPSAGPSA